MTQVLVRDCKDKYDAYNLGYKRGYKRAIEWMKKKGGRRMIEEVKKEEIPAALARFQWLWERSDNDP